MASISTLSLSERENLKTRAEAVLDHIRPALAADGGDARIVDLTEDGRLVVELVGACGGCPMSPQTLKQGIEKVILRDIPEIKSVSAVTHA